MKKIKHLILGILVSISSISFAQATINVNLGTPPVWAPANAEKVQYYYLPEIDTYYDVPAKRYIYIKNGKWYKSAALPAHYRYYNLKKGKTIYLTDYKGKTPYTFYKVHKVKYAKYKGNKYKKMKANILKIITMVKIMEKVKEIKNNFK